MTGESYPSTLVSRNRFGYVRQLMQIAPTIEDDDDVEIVPLALPLDRATISWLNAMSRNDVEAAQHIADILRWVREDDEEADPRVLN